MLRCVRRTQRLLSRLPCYPIRRLTSSSLANDIAKYSGRDPQQLTFQQLFGYARMGNKKATIESAKYLQQEFPIRIAKSLICLENFPYGLSHTPSVQKVHEFYVSSFEEVVQSRPIDNESRAQEFTERLRQRLFAHSNVVQLISLGLIELSESNPGFNVHDSPYLNDFLDQFFTYRLGFRLLALSHLELYETGGSLCESPCDLIKHVNRGIEDAKQTCVRTFENKSPPHVEIIDAMDEKAKNEFSYVPEYVHHMVFELVKNSMRASVENHDESPPIKIVLASTAGDTRVTIKISDCGGGIRRESMNDIWLYTYSGSSDGQSVLDAESRKALLTGAKDVTKNNVTSHRDLLSSVVDSPMFGLGYGLPLVRIYARYFDGDVKMLSMDGFGTDAYLYLNSLDTLKTVLK